jgi:hypothetical protein
MPNETNEIPNEEIELRSYFIWEREGRPDGKSTEHWRRAEEELRAERQGFAKPGEVRVDGHTVPFWDYHG